MLYEQKDFFSPFFFRLCVAFNTFERDYYYYHHGFLGLYSKPSIRLVKEWGRMREKVEENVNIHDMGNISSKIAWGIMCPMNIVL